MNPTLAAPLDIKLMNATASALFMAFACLVIWAVVVWAARSPLFAIGGIAVTGDVSHTNAITLRANVASKLSGTFLTVDLARAPDVRGRALGAPRRGEARFSEPAPGNVAGAPCRGVLGCRGRVASAE